MMVLYSRDMMVVGVDSKSDGGNTDFTGGV